MPKQRDSALYPSRGKRLVIAAIVLAPLAFLAAFYPEVYRIIALSLVTVGILFAAGVFIFEEPSEASGSLFDSPRFLNLIALFGFYLAILSLLVPR